METEQIVIRSMRKKSLMDRKQQSIEGAELVMTHHFALRVARPTCFKKWVGLLAYVSNTDVERWAHLAYTSACGKSPQRTTQSGQVTLSARAYIGLQ